MAATARPAGDRVIVAGRPERVAVVRAFAAALLGAQHPQADTVMLLVSEMVTNSIRHSKSGRPGQTVTVTFTRADGLLRVAVTDRGAASGPVQRGGAAGAEGGRGVEGDVERVHSAARPSARVPPPVLIDHRGPLLFSSGDG